MKEPIGFKACWKFNPSKGRCRMPENHSDDCAFFWCDEDGKRPEAFDSMQDHLKKMVELRASFGRKPDGYNYICMEDYVLDRGQRYEVRPLTEEEQKIVARARRDEIFPESHCYYNAQRLVLADRSKKLLYVEGFASGLFPVLHAWAVINSAVVDVTWESISDRDPRLYYGVEISRDAIRKKRKEKKRLSVLDDAENKYPLLKQERRHREVPQDPAVLGVAKEAPLSR